MLTGTNLLLSFVMGVGLVVNLLQAAPVVYVIK